MSIVSHQPSSLSGRWNRSVSVTSRQARLVRNQIPPLVATVLVTALTAAIHGQVVTPAAVAGAAAQKTSGGYSPAMELWYPYGGPAAWVIGVDGVPRPTMTPGTKAVGQTLAAAPITPGNTSGTGWNAPVTPAGGGPVYGGVAAYPSASTPFATEVFRLQEQVTVSKADASVKPKAQIRSTVPAVEPPQGGPESWAQTVFEKVAGGSEAVVGATNWLKLETKELMTDSLKPLDRVRPRKKCPQCGKRHLPGRRCW